MLVDGVFPYLSEKDILALSCTSKTLHYYTSLQSVWHDLYFETFGGQPNPFTSVKWPEMYKWRSRAGMFTWGEPSNGRLGYQVSSVPESERRNYTAVFRPQQVPGLKDLVVADVVGSGYSFSLLTGTGQIKTMGMLTENRAYATGPRRVPFHGNDRPLLPHAVVPRGPLPHPRHVPLQTGAILPPRGQVFAEPLTLLESSDEEHDPAEQEDRIDYNELSVGRSLSIPRTLEFNTDMDVRIKSISAGRRHLLALDDDNNIWVWDQMYAMPGVKLAFPFNKDGPTKKIRKICAGWNYSTALVEGVGLLVWFDERLQPLPFYKSERATNKKEGKTVDVNPTLVPLTNSDAGSDDYVVDLVACENFLVYVTAGGKLFSVNTSNADKIIDEPRVPLTAFTEELLRLVGHSKSFTAKFVKLSGSYRHFAAFSNTDNVLLGVNPSSSTDPVVVPELQNVGCLSVATGDYHFLALLHGGRLLSWGRESRFCGALGLGNSSEVLAKGGLQENRDVVLNIPIEVEMEGKVLAIAAGGWHSCAIVTTEAIDEDEERQKKNANIPS